MQISFKQKIYRVVKKIPRGKTLTYRQVAEIAGRPGAARAVGTILSKNSDKKTPCHRVIRSDGKIGRYNSINGPSKKELLKREGYSIKK